MFPYELSKVLADQRIRDRVAVGERHRQITAATHGSTDTTRSTRLKDVMRQMLARFHARRGISAHSSVTSVRAGGPSMTAATGGGPIGCSA